jgi:hypothetical protein
MSRAEPIGFSWTVLLAILRLLNEERKLNSNDDFYLASA